MRRMTENPVGWLGVKLARFVAVSMALLCFVITDMRSAQAHEIQPAIADVSVDAETVTAVITLSVEALAAKVDLSTWANTDDDPNAAQYDALRAMSPADLETALRQDWNSLRDGFNIQAGGAPVVPEIAAIQIPEVGNLALTRESVLTVTGALPADGSDVTLGWAARNGPLVIRQVNAGDDAYSDLLEDGQISEPLPRQGYAAETAGSVFLRFIVQGFEHIIPKGMDHIVFVLGLFFFSIQMRPLLVQVTSFTVAHTVTLALAALGIVTLPPELVEPLIAASIVFVAVENIVRPQLGVWRTAVVFFFGLLHGLGFASVLGELGGGQAHFVSRLIGFNIGVEIGQLAVIAVAFLLVGWFARAEWYRRTIAIPASLIIALIGVHWVMDRVFDLGFLPYI